MGAWLLRRSPLLRYATDSSVSNAAFLFPPSGGLLGPSRRCLVFAPSPMPV